MNEPGYTDSLNSAKNRERRYQWAITTILSISFLMIGFLGGVVFQTSAYKEKIVVNTVEIRILKERLTSIEGKLDRLLGDKK